MDIVGHSNNIPSFNQFNGTTSKFPNFNEDKK